MIQSFTALSLIAKGILREIISDIEVSAPSSSPISPQKIDKIQTKALWDTGASNCCITKNTAEKLGLKPIRITKVIYGNQEADSNVYLCNLHLPNGINIKSVEVTECYSKDNKFGVIIGMDIICLGDFAITNVNKKTTFSYRFPSVETIDYAEMAKKLTNASYDRGRNKPCGCGSGLKYKFCHGKPNPPT